jgi:hypothetical protein
MFQKLTSLSGNFGHPLLMQRVYFQPTNSMEQSTSWKANSRSVSQQILRLLRNQKVHYCVHKSPPLDPLLRQMNSVHIPKP